MGTVLEKGIGDMAQILDILERNEGFGPAGLDHFKFRDGDNIAPEVVIQQDNIVPYCLDHASRRLIFVDLPADTDLSTAPFVYSMQKEHAKRLIAVPYDELADLTQNLKLPENLILIYSTGRAGSTLMSQILNEVDNIVSFSEPDIFLNLVPIVYHAKDRFEYLELVEYSLKLFTHQRTDKTVAIKFRGECIDIADLFYRVMPSAKNLYLYRETIKWASSWWRLFQGFGATEYRSVEEAASYGMRFTGRITTLQQIIGDDPSPVHLITFFMSLYFFYVEAYYLMHKQGIPFLAMRYQDLNTHREAMLTKVFDYVGLPQDQLQSALKGFERDSQAGTGLARKNDSSNQEMLNDEQIKMIRDILTRHPLNLEPDTILPNTIFP